jgi:transcriptional regulator with XRE-family HTH domain
VRAWREHRGLTVGALAKEAGIAQSYVSEIEHGRKRGSVRALAALAKPLRVDIEDLLAPKD